MHHHTLQKTTLLTAVALLVGGMSGLSAQQTAGPPEDADVVYVNSQQVLQQAPGASEAQQTWNQEVEQYRAEVQELAAEIDSMRQALEQQRDVLNDSAIQRREQEIGQKQQELNQRAQQLEERAAERRDELLGPILQRVGQVIEGIRAERGYSMVFDISASGVRAADPQLDITDLVIERLQEDTSETDAGSGS